MFPRRGLSRRGWVPSGNHSIIRSHLSMYDWCPLSVNKSALRISCRYRLHGYWNVALFGTRSISFRFTMLRSIALWQTLSQNFSRRPVNYVTFSFRAIGRLLHRPKPLPDVINTTIDFLTLPVAGGCYPTQGDVFISILHDLLFHWHLISSGFNVIWSSTSRLASLHVAFFGVPRLTGKNGCISFALRI